MPDAYDTGRSTHTPVSVDSKAALGRYLTNVLKDFRDTGKSEWENNSLERFLDGLAAFVSDSPTDRPPSWQLFAEFISVATGYE